MKFAKLFIPGPTHVSDELLEEFSNPQIGHRTPDISQIIDCIVKGVQKLLYTKNHIYLVSHAATGLWEMGTKNSVQKGVLHAVNGAFSSKWALSSEQLGFETKRLNFEWGSGIDIDLVDQELSTGKYDVFAMVHNETSTGAETDNKQLSVIEKGENLINKFKNLPVDISTKGVGFEKTFGDKDKGFNATVFGRQDFGRPADYGAKLGFNFKF